MDHNKLNKERKLNKKNTEKQKLKTDDIMGLVMEDKKLQIFLSVGFSCGLFHSDFIVTDYFASML